MDSTRLFYLYQQCIQGAATIEEQEEYLHLMQLPENEKQARELLRKAFPEQKEVEDAPVPVSSAVLQAILQAGEESGSATIPEELLIPRFRFLRKRWISLSVAAALLGMILTGALLFLKHKEEIVPELTGQPAVKDIVPADNKAVLTLADGTVIKLDEVDNGALKQQGNMQVVKIAGGKLVYKKINSDRQGIAADVRLSGNEATSYNTLTTPRGGLFQVTLPDDTRVWLNSASSLRYPASFTGHERRVELTGEGYFEVASDNKHPFFVKLRDMEVQVLGTDFNIMAYEDEEAIRTSLIRGSVKIISPDGMLIVEPGQQASLPKAGGRLVLSKPDMEQVLGWRNGQMSFSSAELPVVMRGISRWYDVDIKYKDGVPAGRFNGLIDRNLKLSNVLEVLEVYGIHSRLEGRTITVLP